MQQKNGIKRLLSDEKVVFGATAITLSPVMMEVYADIGLDYVWLDHEHTGPSTSDALHFESIRRTTTAVGIEPIIRVESPDKTEVRKVIDAGIRTYVVPRITQANQIREIISTSKFEYDDAQGDRGLGTCAASKWGNPPPDHIESEDESLLVGIMIENEEAVKNIDEIFSVPELGFAQIGPTDLSVSMGHPLERTHPQVQDAIDTIIKAGRKHNVPVGVSTGYVGGLETAIDKGCRLIKLGNDIGAARALLGEELEKGLIKTDRTLKD